MKAKLKLWMGRFVRLERRLKRIALAHGMETEVMLYMWPDGMVDLHVGNPTGCVMLGEVNGEKVFEGKTVDAAVTSAERFYFPHVTS